MNTLPANIITIKKEKIADLYFPNQPLILSDEAIAQKKYNIERAMKLGNNFKNKVKIVFEDAEGKKMIETTVWGVTDKSLLLNKGLLIPLHRIHDVII